MEQFGLTCNRKKNNNVEKMEVFDAIFIFPKAQLLDIKIRKDVQEFGTCHGNKRLENAQINQITNYKEGIGTR